MPPRTITRRELERRQAEALWLSGRRRLETMADAERFLESVGIALRYGPNPTLPLASMYRAAAGPDPEQTELTHAMELTNHLLGTARAIEVDVIAGRLTLVHRSLIPALYVLVRRGRRLDDLTGVSLHARAAHQLLRQRRELSAGDVRKHLGLTATPPPRSDPAYEALAELRRLLLVDRGPFEIAKSGISYLSKEGYPYHLFHKAHADLLRASLAYSVGHAAERFLGGYLEAAVFCSMRKLASMFQAFLTRLEIEAALERLVAKDRIEMMIVGRDRLAVSHR